MTSARLIADGNITITTQDYEVQAEILFLGERLFIRVEDPDLDISAERDTGHRPDHHRSPARARASSSRRRSAHSGDLHLLFRPASGRTETRPPTTARSRASSATRSPPATSTRIPASQDSQLVLKQEIPIAEGTDGVVAAFSKIFGDEDLAIQTQFHIAESYFELFKSHLALEREEEANRRPQLAGRKVLRELAGGLPGPEIRPARRLPARTVLSGAQGVAGGDRPLTRPSCATTPEHTLAADAQYKLGQCHEQAGEFDAALDAYVALAATYPDSPLIASVMMRINEPLLRRRELRDAPPKSRRNSSRNSPTTSTPRAWPSASARATTRTRTTAKAGESLRRVHQGVPRRRPQPAGIVLGR